MLKIGDLVDVKDRRLSHYGKVIELLKSGNVRVRFRTPKKPKDPGFCDRCGSFNISLNGSTGEITCMRSGCGHDHGFEERDEVIHFRNLINISEQCLDEKKAEFKLKLKSMIQHGATESLLTSDEANAILRLLS